MSVSQTVLIFVGVPALITLVVGGLAYFSGGSSRARRYRPGRPFDFAPVWFLSTPPGPEPGSGGHRELAGRTQAPALTSGETEQSGGNLPQGATGGASDSW